MMLMIKTLDHIPAFSGQEDNHSWINSLCHCNLQYAFYNVYSSL